MTDFLNLFLFWMNHSFNDAIVKLMNTRHFSPLCRPSWESL